MKTTPDTLTEELTRAARLFGVARVAVEAQVAEALVEAVVLHPAGIAELDARALAQLPFEIVWRVLARVTTTVSGEEKPPRYETLVPLAQAVATATLKRHTLSGVMFSKSTSPKVPHTIYVMREPNAWASATEIAAGETMLWDKRFRVYNHSPHTLRIVPMKVPVAKLTPPLFARKSGTVSIPAAFHLEECVAAPHIDRSKAEVTIDFLPAKPLADPAFITTVAPSQRM